MNLVQFGDYCHVNDTEFSNPWIRMSFPLFRSLSFLSALFCGFSVHMSRTSWVTFVPKYFVISDAVVNRRVFLILLSDPPPPRKVAFHHSLFGS